MTDMARDVLFTNGIIAAREKYFLKDKIVKLCETDAEEALRVLTESGFGKGADIASVYDYEKLVADDERATDDFIREFAPSDAEAAYLLSPRDFHNAKALVKAHFLGIDAEKLLAPEGLVSVALISRCVADGDYGMLYKELADAVREASDGLSEGALSGAETGAVFDKACYAYLSSVCSKKRILKKLLAAKADMTNILTAVRAESAEYAEKFYVDGGKLSFERLGRLFDGDEEGAERAFGGTPYGDFVKTCLSKKSAGLPLTEAERILDSYETKYFYDRRFELERSEPFLYYVFRRRAENADVRILFVCLLAGMRDNEIKARLRSF